ncbi:MAG: hypothetical protein R6W90_03020 [Ignavibacteriaceae bacterium]
MLVRPNENNKTKKSEKKSNSGYYIFNGTVIDLSWPEINKAAEVNTFVLLPVGVVEYGSK